MVLSAGGLESGRVAKSLFGFGWSQVERATYLMLLPSNDHITSVLKFRVKVGHFEDVVESAVL